MLSKEICACDWVVFFTICLCTYSRKISVGMNRMLEGHGREFPGEVWLVQRNAVLFILSDVTCGSLTE